MVRAALMFRCRRKMRERELAQAATQRRAPARERLPRSDRALSIMRDACAQHHAAFIRTARLFTPRFIYERCLRFMRGARALPAAMPAAFELREDVSKDARH